MASIADSFPALEALYAELPAVPCRGCGACCVSPHMTLLEFAYMLDGLLRNLHGEAVALMLLEPTAISHDYDGNHHCAIQGKDNRCRLHAWRCLACRLEGNPVLDRMGFRDQPACRRITELDMPIATPPAEIETWAERVRELGRAFVPAPHEPYWLDVLNIECWWAVLLDPRITQSCFLRIRGLVREEWNLDPLAAVYRDHTRLAEKLTCIDRVFACALGGQPHQALAAARQACSHFPRTGSFFLQEGQAYCQALADIVQRSACAGG